MSAPTPVSPNVIRLVQFVDGAVVRVARYWMAGLLIILFLFQAFPFVAPLLSKLGLTDIAGVLYFLYGLTCHQLAYRSFFLFGSQPAYTVQELSSQLGVSNPPMDVFFWRGITGDADLGYKVAYCERDVAIYSSLFLAALAFALISRARTVKPLDFKFFVLIAVVPLGIDGVTQLLGLRESTPLLRVITGTLFGVGSAWLILPYVQEAMLDLYQQTSWQLERIRQRNNQAAM